MENYFNKIIELYAKTNTSGSTRDEFFRWITGENHAGEKEKALHDLWDQTSVSTSSEASAATWQSLSAVHEKIRLQQRRAYRRLLHFWQIAAACLLIALLSAWYITERTTPAAADLIELYTPTAEMRQLTLPDGSEVHMNSAATLLYPAQFTGKSRSVYLIGEAYFKIARDIEKPFIVKSSDFQVTALGTEFNIKAYPGDSTLSATLLSGSVEVKFNHLSSALILEPNEQLTYNRFTKKESIDRPDISDVTAWQRGELVFKSTTLEEIIAVLERKYPYSFVYALNTLKEDEYTFRFKENTSLPEVMDIIVSVSGSIRYRIEDDICYIQSL